jgi:hypothetical protein
MVALARHKRGNVTVLFAMSLPLLMVGGGVAVDYSTAVARRAQLQTAIDSAVIGGVVKPAAQRAAEADALFSAHSVSVASGVGAPTFVNEADSVFSGSVTASLANNVLGVFGRPTTTVHARARARPSIKDEACILTLGRTMTAGEDSMTFNGASSVDLSGCTLQSNTSMVCNGHTSGATRSLAVGSAGTCDHPVDNSPAIPDIYADLAGNISPQCGASNYNVNWSATSRPNASRMVTVTAGGVTRYHVCGDLTLSGTHELNTSGGDAVLVVENGSLTIQRDAAISMSRMAIVMTGDPARSHTISFPQGNGQTASLSITPPTDVADPWRGIAIYQDPALTTNVDVSWGPGANLRVDGVIYFPHADFTMSGNATSNGSNCTKLVTDTLTINGVVDFQQNDAGCAAIGMRQYATKARLIQ